MKKDENKNGVSLFSQSEFLIDNDPMEEIFALNLGDFLSEHLISKDLAEKIGEHSKDKKTGLKNQLSELISIYSLKNTLCVLNFETQKDFTIITSIAKSIAQMVDTKICNIYLAKEFAKGLAGSDMQLVLAGSSAELQIPGYNVDSDSVVARTYLAKDTAKCENAIGLSIHSASQNIGVIELKTGTLQEEFIELVESIATLFATSMTLQSMIDETHRLIEDENSETTDLQHMRAELTSLIGDLCDYQQAFVQNLANAVDTKGGYKVSHSKNTANLARKICKQLGLNEKTTDLIYYAGLLQNIGKITLPESIFATNGKLSDEDFQKIQNHANVGVNLLMNINFLSEVVPYITYQKERVDGSGTPEGLKGQSIPFGSRIIAVADAYSAMTSDRPYRKAMPVEKALSIMKEEAGTKWDVDVVNALAEVAGEN